VCLKVSENIFWVIFVSKRFDAGKNIYLSKIDFEKCFVVNRTKQPEGCIGIIEKCVFAWKSLSSRYREQLECFLFFLAIAVLQVLFLNLINLGKNATRRAVDKSRAEVFSLKKNKPTHCFLSGPHVFPCCFSPLGE